MRTPEELAREIECEHIYPDDTDGGRCATHYQQWPCNDSAVRYVAHFIRERDGEVLRDAADTLSAMARVSTAAHRQDGWRAAAQVLADLAEHHEGVSDD